jgi:protein-disulfide isomerase/uncharacterized membrane protein
MSKALSNVFILVMASVGLVVTLILTYLHYHPDVSMGCSEGPCGCHGLLQSQYGHLGPIPTSLFGFGMYAAFLGLGLRRRGLLRARRLEESARAAAYASAVAEAEARQAGSEEGDTPAVEPLVRAAQEKAAPSNLAGQIRLLDTAVWALALIGVVTSWWLQYVAIFVIESFCPWCLTSAILVTLIFLLASRDFLLDGRALGGEQKMMIGVSVFILVMLGLMNQPRLAGQFFLISQKCLDRKTVDGPDKAKFLITPDMHIKGDPKAKILVVEFADYMCPACGDASPLVRDYMKKFPDKFRLGFRQYPLDLPDHRWSKEAARAAEAAARQGKFWEMHEYIFDHQKDMKSDDFLPTQFSDFAAAVGLDVQKFKKDFQDPAIAARVAKDIQDGRAIGVNTTPSFFFITPKGIFRATGQAGFKKVTEDPNHPVWRAAAGMD